MKHGKECMLVVGEGACLSVCLSICRGCSLRMERKMRGGKKHADEGREAPDEEGSEEEWLFQNNLARGRRKRRIREQDEERTSRGRERMERREKLKSCQDSGRKRSGNVR